MKKHLRYLVILIAISSLLFSCSQEVFARGGGGGSSGGGGDSGGGGIIKLVVIVIMAIYAWHVRKKRIKKAKELVSEAVLEDPTWNEHGLKQRVSEVFFYFQEDWSNFNTERMKNYLTEEYYKRIILELQVLKNQHRQNLMKDFKIKSINMWDVVDGDGKDGDRFGVEIKAWANDILLDTNTNTRLYSDLNDFTEFWYFVRKEGVWRLDIIKQNTEDKNMIENSVERFARANDFFYDPDFGWLMMPNKGVIFRKSNFKTSDINNHVIGVHKGKIIEFYTFVPVVARGRYESAGINYLVAQTNLPVSYNDILVRRRRSFWNFAPRGLRLIHTESNDFNKKFCLYAHKNDQINSFVLLAPDFMEEVYNLPFELNIEIVGSFLYFYTKGRKNVDEHEMLRLLSKAFDSMKTG